ncbi:AAA family ATPase [Bradyrhizobium sp. AT1]|uniref:P-loop ATPase, Sll1717 family n=1 Tax=Bradyrhizobium sp. AT1 TaxID=574934 RepID=UPI000B11E0DE|nr:AAA family ATPase [Bradyrhizobium sp. AT1]
MPKFDDETIETLFGADDAEHEKPERFKQYFFYNGAYDSVVSNLAIRVLVGHKGVGKSALLKRAFLADSEASKIAFWLQSGDIDAIRPINSTASSLVARIEGWKQGISAFLASSLLKLLDPETYESTLDKIRSGSTASLREVYTRAIEIYAKERGVDPGAVTVTLYIDDIDRGWTANSEDIKNISALLNAMRDIAGPDDRIRFRIGLRSDVYFLVRTSDESTDKIERNVIWIKWNNDEILRLAAKRIQTFFKVEVDEKALKALQQPQITQTILSKVIDPVFRGKGHWDNRPIHNVLLSLTRARPRDLVKLFHGAARRAQSRNHQIISSEDLDDSFQSYSQERLQDIINEFRTELPQIENLLLNMRPTKKQYRTAEIISFRPTD